MVECRDTAEAAKKSREGKEGERRAKGRQDDEAQTFLSGGVRWERGGVIGQSKEGR